jgi:hypothetical protein
MSAIPYQRGLFPRERSRATVAGRVDQYRAVNLECACIIAGDPVKYPGLMQEWARLVLDGVEHERPAWRLAA